MPITELVAHPLDPFFGNIRHETAFPGQARPGWAMLGSEVDGPWGTNGRRGLAA
jgi:hypothetical protein